MIDWFLHLLFLAGILAIGGIFGLAVGFAWGHQHILKQIQRRQDADRRIHLVQVKQRADRRLFEASEKAAARRRNYGVLEEGDLV